MLMPKRVKFRRMQRGRMTGKATRGNTVSYGEYGLMALEPGWVKSNQIEAARIAMTRYTKRGDTGGLDLIAGDPGGLSGDKTEFTVGDGVAAHGLTGHTAALHATILYSLRQKH